MGFQETLLANWRRPSIVSILLLPLSLLYGCLVWLRRHAYQSGMLSSYAAPVPVIVIGNLTVGGSGKTPLVISLVEQMREQGFKPGVISRGYAGNSADYPVFVNPESSPADCGDEPALIVRRTGAPMTIGPDRSASIAMLLSQSDCDLVISDDGLQHYALQRDIDICVVDESVELSNFFLLPAGPYRESRSRIADMDIVVKHVAPGAVKVDGSSTWMMALEASEPVSLSGDHKQPLSNSLPVHAIAGIGQPQRFFDELERLGFQIIRHAFPDHHAFVASDLEFGDDLAVMMTEKDAVKCQQFANEKHWYLPVSAKLSSGSSLSLGEKIARKLNESKQAHDRS